LLLQSAYEEAFRLAKISDCKTVTLCCLSTGAYRWEPRRAAHIALNVARKALIQNPDLQILFCIVRKF
jgi:O-acetyl-ADP-ribose deacetylase (regulator of RNase III)